MKDFFSYQVEDFAMDPDFIRWIFEDRAEDRSFWEQWLTTHPEKRPIVEEARTILLSVKIKEQEPGDEMVRREIRKIIHEAQRRSRTGIFARISGWKYAAIAVGLIGAAGLLYKIQPTQTGTGSPLAALMADLPPRTDGMAEEVNTGAKEKVILLPDGSKIHLWPGSAVRYSGQFSSARTREVYLSGEAFFEVAKSPDKPFSVFSHELVTKVLGTSFTVRAGENAGDIAVIVRSGKVSVYHKDAEQNAGRATANKLTGVILTPNQELIYARKQEKFQKILIDTPVLINPVEIKTGFQYEDVPVATVIEQLKRAFDIDIVYDKEAVKNCRITADLRDESIYKKLDLICKAMDATYEMIDGVVTIQARPCH